MFAKSYVELIIKNIRSNYLRMIIGAIISFTASIVFARGLGPAKYGIYMYITWFTGTIVCLCGLGIQGTITKFLPQYYFIGNIEDSRLIIRKAIKLQIIIISIISFLLFITIQLWKGMLSLATSNIYVLLVLAIFNILPTILCSIFTSSIQALQRFDIVARVTIQTQIITFILNLISIILFKKVEYILIILIFSTIYQVIIYYKEIKKIINFNIKDVFKNERVMKEDKRIKKYATYMYINVIWQQVVWTRSEYLFLGIYCNTKEIAVYGLAYSLVNMVNMIFSPTMTVLNNYFSELVAKKEENLLKSIIQEVTKCFVIVFLLILTYAYAFSKYVINFIYSNKYDGVVTVFLIMLTGFVIVQILSVFASIPFYYEKQKFVINVGIISGILNILLDILLIPKYGVLGAAVANTAAQVSFSIIQYIYIVKKVISFEFSIKQAIILIILNGGMFFAVNIFDNMLISKIIKSILLTIIILMILIKLNIINLKQYKNIFNGG